MKALFFSYVLGAITFWPLVFVLYVLCSRWLAEPEPQAAQPSKPVKSRAYGPQQWFKLWESGEDIPLDRDSEAEAASWVYFSTKFVRSGESGDEAEGATPTQSSDAQDANEKNARSSLQKIVGTSVFHHQSKPAPNEKSAKSLSKLPKYWAVVRGGQLQLYEDQKEKRLYNFVLLPEFVVTLWPQDLQEFELFYKRYPICLIARNGREGLVTLDLSPGMAPRDAMYLYVENPTVKEDLYFALIKDSKLRLPTTDPATSELSLGPRDPIEMARPIRIPKAEIQELQSQIWSSELPGEAKWLNALIGRLFFALKNSEWADEYLRRKFTYKLRPISASSGIIGDIEVRKIVKGSSPPLVHDVKLRELTPDGNLVLSAKVKYTGGSRVHLATMVKLSAVTSLTTAEIPIELAATLQHLEGTMVFRIKPAPSDRIWYAFETMPDIDLQMEPVVYDTQISLSVVTKYIKNRVVETLRETLVMPYMDDLSFYDTARSFYRGGIWETAAANVQKQSSSSSTQVPQTTTSAPTSAESSIKTMRQRKEGSVGSMDSPDPTENYEQATPPLAPSLTPGPVPGGLTVGPAPEQTSSSKVRRFSDWVKRKRSSRSLKPAVPDLSEEPESSAASTVGSFTGSVGGSDTASLLSMSPGSVRQRTASTTQVTTANATTTRRGSGNGVTTPASAQSVSKSPPRRVNHVPRKPVPEAAPEPEDQALSDLVDPYEEPNYEYAGNSSAGHSSAELSPALDSPDKWQPSVVVPKPRPSLAESSANASGVQSDSASVISQELEDQEKILRRSLSQRWTPSRSVDSPSSSPPRSSSRRTSQPSSTNAFDQQSINSLRSTGSSGSRRKQPTLPPRNRKFVPLTNVPPEHANK